MTRRNHAAVVAAALAAALAGAIPAKAQDYPTRPITLIVPYTPGGGNDAMARVVADKMSVSLGRQIVIEKPRRRRRLDRDPPGRSRRAGRLHARARRYRHARHRSHALSQCRV
jgi:hypothetical protein